MNAPPPITVLMAVRNGVAHLPESLASIRDQSCGDFELLVVEDFSSDATPDLLTDAARMDPRLHVLRNPRHLGLTRSLNVGLGQARGDFIARLDADDLMEPQRLAIQLAHLRDDPGLVLLGSDTRYIDAGGNFIPKPDPRPPLTNAAIRWMLLFDNAFYHSAVMFRRQLPDWPQGVLYDESFQYAQDRALWNRLLASGRAANLPEPLTRCRMHPRRLTTPELRHARAQPFLAHALAPLAELLPDHPWDPAEVLALKQAWEGFPPPPITPDAMRPALTLLRLFLAFQARHPHAELTDERRFLMEHLLFLISGHWDAAWRSGILPLLLTRAPGALTHALLRKLSIKWNIS